MQRVVNAKDTRYRGKTSMQNITGEIQTALTPVEYFATSFIHVHHAGNLN